MQPGEWQTLDKDQLAGVNGQRGHGAKSSGKRGRPKDFLGGEFNAKAQRGRAAEKKILEQPMNEATKQGKPFEQKLTKKTKGGR